MIGFRHLVPEAYQAQHRHHHQDHRDKISIQIYQMVIHPRCRPVAMIHIVLMEK